MTTESTPPASSPRSLTVDSVELARTKCLFSKVFLDHLVEIEHERGVAGDQQARAIGRSLYGLGGASLLQRSLLRFKRITGPTPAARLAICWEGIADETGVANSTSTTRGFLDFAGGVFDSVFRNTSGTGPR